MLLFAIVILGSSCLNDFVVFSWRLWQSKCNSGAAVFACLLNIMT
jgi:hypothetical protein